MHGILPGHTNALLCGYTVVLQGTVNLVELAKQKGVKKIVLVSSIGAGG